MSDRSNNPEVQPVDLDLETQAQLLRVIRELLGGAEGKSVVEVGRGVGGVGTVLESEGAIGTYYELGIREATRLRERVRHGRVFLVDFAGSPTNHDHSHFDLVVIRGLLTDFEDPIGELIALVERATLVVVESKDSWIEVEFSDGAGFDGADEGAISRSRVIRTNEVEHLLEKMGLAFIRIEDFRHDGTMQRYGHGMSLVDSSCRQWSSIWCACPREDGPATVVRLMTLSGWCEER